MSGQAAGSMSDSNSNSRFDQRIWKGQAPFLKDLFAKAQELYSGQFGNIQGQVPGAVQGMQGVTDQAQNAWGQQLKGGVYGGLGIGNELMQSLNQSLNKPTSTQSIYSQMMGGQGNNYADAMKQQYINDANKSTQNMMANLDARVSAGGLPGSSRHGVAQALGMRDINSNLQRNMAETGYNTFDKDLQNKLMIAQQADQGTLSRQQMLQNMLGQQNQSQSGAIGMGQNIQGLNMGQFSPYSAPWAGANALANILGNPQVLSGGSSNSNSKSLAQSGGGGM